MEMIWQQEQVVLCGGRASFHLDRRSGRLLLSRITGEDGEAREYPSLDLIADAGMDGRYVRGQMAYDSLLDKRTWELPAIHAADAPDGGEFMGFTEEDGCLVGTWRTPAADIRQLYDLCGEALRLRAEVVNRGPGQALINGLSFLYRRQAEDAFFEYPANEAWRYEDGHMRDGEAHACGLVGSMTHIQRPAGSLNLLFLDEVEKWSQGAYRTGDLISHVYAAAVECLLAPGGRAQAGCLYVCPVPQGSDPYLQIRDFFEGLGFRPLKAGLREGVLYSCHPHGTMDGGFGRQMTLQEYAAELPAIKALGVDHLWLLPVFDHRDRGVYHPTDQRPIDARYGGEEGMKAFADAAHALGISVLFDYVPHGPEPEDPLAKAQPQWCARRLDGGLQDEWNCISFDMTNPDYLAYTRELVASHVRRFDIDGARIDCAMGGLSNWQPFPGHRPSASNLMGGVSISRAIQEGFERMGKRAFLLPENFNPVPAYYPVTGVFYGMNLYRAMTLLWERGIEGAEYVSMLTRFLDIEHRVMPLGLRKLRFLGNHDTVSWVWQKQRAYQSYGVDKAKALFALMFLLDGVPMIYQGDEDPRIAGKEGPVLREHFALLSRVRRELIGDGDEISHIQTGGPVFAFIRPQGHLRRLVLISVSDQPEELCLPEIKGARLVAGEAVLRGEHARLLPCGWAVLTMAG